MASKNKSFTIKSRTFGNQRVTVPADTYNEISQYHWYLDAVGKDRKLVARTRFEDGSRAYLQRMIYATDAKLQPQDGNFLNCSEKNMVAL